MFKAYVKNKTRKKRHLRIRRNLMGTIERPRLCVFRSSKNMYAQLIDDAAGKTLASASTLETLFKEKGIASSNKDAATAIGELVAQRALAIGVESVIFDRGGYIYHGRVKALADGARKAGLKF